MTPDQPSSEQPRDEQPDLSSSPFDLGSSAFFSLIPALERFQIPKHLKPIEEATLRFQISATLRGALPQSEGGMLSHYQRYSILIKRILGLDNSKEDPALKNSTSDYQIVPLSAAVGTNADVSILLGVKDLKSKSWVIYNSALRTLLRIDEDEPNVFLDQCSRLPEKEGFAGVSLHLEPYISGLKVYLSFAMLPKNLEKECSKFLASEPSFLAGIIAAEVEQIAGRREDKLTLLSTGADTSDSLKEFLISSEHGPKYAFALSFPSPGLCLHKRYLLRFTDAAPAELVNSPEQRLISAFEESQRSEGFIVSNLENGEEAEDKIGLELSLNAEALVRQIFSNNWRDDWKVRVINISRMPDGESSYMLCSIQDDKLDCFIPGERENVVARDPLFSGIILGYHYQAELDEEASAYLPPQCSVKGQIRVEGSVVSPEWVSEQLRLLKMTPQASVLYGSLNRLIIEDLDYRLGSLAAPGGITVEFAPVASGNNNIIGAGILCSHAQGKHLFWFRYDRETGFLGKDLGLTIETYYPDSNEDDSRS